MTTRAVHALLSPPPLWFRYNREARNTTVTTVPLAGVVLGLDGKCLITLRFSDTYYEYYEYYGQSPIMRPRAHVVSWRSIRSIRSIPAEKTAFPGSYREREILQRGPRCVCVCSIIYSYPCQVVAKDTQLSFRDRRSEVSEPRAGALRTRPSRNRIIPCRFNHWATVSSLVNQTVTNLDLDHVCRDRSRSLIFREVSQHTDIKRVSGRARGRARGFRPSRAVRIRGPVLIPNWLRARPRASPPARPRHAGRGGHTPVDAGPGKNFRSSQGRAPA